jgi:protein phosphatase
MLDRGEISPAQAARHPSRGQLTRYVGMHVDASPDVRIVEVQPHDQFLLCTDGLCEMLEDPEITAHLKQEPGPREACQRLITRANEAGGHDNITAVVIGVAAGR